MGIDAEMFVKVQGRENWLSDEEIGCLSYDAAEAFGRHSFLIYDLGHNWSSRPMQKIEPLSPAEAAKMESPDLALRMVIWQDGPPIVAREDEQFIRVNLATRYYGEHYERGDFPFIFTLAKWLELRIPQGEVHYGGDSSGVKLELFDAGAREELFEHYARHGHKPYAGTFNSGTQARCAACGNRPMENTGGSRDAGFFQCPGCGKRAVTNKNRGEVMRELGPGEDWGDVHLGT